MKKQLFESRPSWFDVVLEKIFCVIGGRGWKIVLVSKKKAITFNARNYMPPKFIRLEQNPQKRSQ